MDAAVERNPQQLSRGAFERRVGDVRVRPLDEHAFVIDVARRRSRRRRGVPCDHETGNARVVRNERAGLGRILDMNRVELPVVRIVGIEFEADEPARQPVLDRQLVEQSGTVAPAVEVEIGRKLLRVPVEDVERTVQVVDEEAVRRGRLLPQEVDARQRAGVVAQSVGCAGDRQRRIVGDLQRQLRGSLGVGVFRRAFVM